MKRDGYYRFNLQFPAVTEEQVQAGELLERLDNRKSAVVVAALGEYLAAHPALINPECKVEIKTAQAVQPEQLQAMIERMLSERIGTPDVTAKTEPNDTDTSKNISELLNILDAF